MDNIKDYEQYTINSKIFYIKTVLKIYIVLMTFFSIYNFLYGANSLGFIELVSFVLSIYLLKNVQKDVYKSAIYILLIISFTIAFALTQADYANNDLLWSVIVPVNAFYLLKKKDAFMISGLFFLYLVYHIMSISVAGVTMIVQVNVIGSYSIVVMVSYLHKRSRDKSIKLNEKLINSLNKLSSTDKLTNLYNRFKIDNIMEHELQRARRYHTALSLAIIDIDHFKYVNDTHGHQAGDTVLKEFSNLLLLHTRKSDHLGRWGGEEFLLLLPNTNLEDAVQMSKYLKDVVQKTKFSFEFSNTCSIGVATFHDGDTVSKFIEKADKALYEAKSSGRNLVVSEKEI